MKNKKIVKKLFAGVMAMTLCLGTTMVASATEGDQTPTAPVPESKTVALTKVFDVPDNVTTPDATFTFNFVQDKTVENSTDQDAEIPAATLKFSNADTKTDGRMVKETRDILRNTTFPAAGVYAYHVTEAQSGVTLKDNSESMTYDQTSYLLRVYVKNGEDGKPVVDGATVEKEGGEGEGGDEAKVDPTPTPGGDGGNGEDDQNTEVDPSTDQKDLEGKFAFFNAYNKNGGGVIDPVDPDPVDPDPDTYALKVSKEVVGEYGDQAHKFDFQLELKLPSSAATAGITTVKGFVCDAKGNLLDTIEFKNGKEGNSFQLAHGEYLTFKSIPAGTAYVVTETGTTNYTGSTAAIVNGEAGKNVTGTKSETLVGAENLVGADAANSTAVTNAYDDQAATPTGILVNNLPYIAIILVAVVGCVVIVASRKRRAN